MSKRRKPRDLEILVTAGSFQNTRGKQTEGIVKTFEGMLKKLDSRETVEARIEALHGIASFPRFRKKLMMLLAQVYITGAYSTSEKRHAVPLKP